MWEKYNGKVPKGHEVHHKDENKDNNEIENLMCMTRKEHLRWHSENIPESRLKKWRDNLDKYARPKAAEWHKSDEGREWHSKMAKKAWESRKSHKLTCAVCKTEYESPKSWSKFCSGKCAAQDRRNSGKDDVKRKCVICEMEFKANKYSTKKTCSKSCLSELLSQNHWKKKSQL